jgi:uncharacterized membrane protein YeaQ/YmgE (transglycosylase-associated protein family)
MDLVEVAYVLLIGIAAGWIAGRLTRNRGFGLIGNLVIGIIGALVGAFLLPRVGLKATGLLGFLIQSTVGALVLLLLLGLAFKKRSRRR